jgi:hypothetical protein
MSRYLGVPARVLLLMLALSIVPVLARADSFLYTVTDTFPFFVTSFSFIQPTLASSGDITSGFTLISGLTPTEFAWDSGPGGSCLGTGSGSSGCAGIKFSAGSTIEGFPAGSFLSPGTYTGAANTMTVNITQTGVPEPSSLLLLGSGVLGLLGTVRRKLRA